MSINSRIAQIIQVKTGSQKLFAEKFGWKPQYVGKLVRDGGSVGIDPVTKILAAYPDIDGRWLILGEGDMIIQSKFTEVRSALYNSVRELLDLEKYLPFMSSEEIDEYKKAAAGLRHTGFSGKQIDRWEKLHRSKAGGADAES